MDAYFMLDYRGEPFALFGSAHLFAIVIVVLANWAMVVWLRSEPGAEARDLLRYGLATLCALNQAAWDGWQIYAGIWQIAYSLPLQICTLSGVLCVVMLLTKSKRLYNLLYFWGMAGAGMALITPDLLIYGFPHFRFWLFFTAHGGVITAVVFMTAAEGMRPQWRTVWQAALTTIVYLCFAMLANAATGGNYLYIARKPEFPTLIDYLGPWPVYAVGLLGVGVAMFVLVYLPFAIHDWRTRRAALR